MHTGDGLTRLVAEEINFREVHSVWWRRPEKPNIDRGVTEDRVRDFCLEETTRFFRGLAAVSGVIIINDPDLQERANRKAFQLKTASAMGLKIPDTIMTNDPDSVRQLFKRLGGNCIYKTFRSPRWQLVETRRLEHDDLARLELLRHAPVIVQEYVPRKRDIRATVIEDEVFCACPATNSEEA